MRSRSFALAAVLAFRGVCSVHGAPRRACELPSGEPAVKDGPIFQFKYFVSSKQATFLDVLASGFLDDVFGAVPLGAFFVRDATTTSNATETGTCAVDEVNNGLTYRPPSATFDGSAECEYTACKKQDTGDCEEFAVFIASTPGPAVVTIADFFTISSNVTNSTLEVLATDDSLNPSGRDLFVESIVEGPTGGRGECTVDASNEQVVLYNPPNNTFDGTQETCRYKACLRSNPWVCQVETVFISAIPVDTPAVAAMYDEYKVFAREPTDLDVTTNDESLNPPGRPLVVTNITSNAREARGNCTANGTNVLTFTPAKNFVGVATCQYKVCTSDADDEVCGEVTVRITVKEATMSKSGKKSSRKGGKGGKKLSTKVTWEEKSSNKGGKKSSTEVMWGGKSRQQR